MPYLDPDFVDLPRDWMRGAPCRGAPLDLFFPESPAASPPEVCGRCPLSNVCLAYALAYREKGSWGNMSEAKRQTVRKHMNRARCVQLFWHALDHLEDPCERLVAANTES